MNIYGAFCWRRFKKGEKKTSHSHNFKTNDKRVINNI